MWKHHVYLSFRSSSVLMTHTSSLFCAYHRCQNVRLHLVWNITKKSYKFNNLQLNVLKQLNCWRHNDTCILEDHLPTYQHIVTHRGNAQNTYVQVIAIRIKRCLPFSHPYRGNKRSKCCSIKVMKVLLSSQNSVTNRFLTVTLWVNALKRLFTFSPSNSDAIFVSSSPCIKAASWPST